MKHVPLEEYEDNLVTRMGAWFPGKQTIFRGVDLHETFADADWMDLFVFGITGRRLASDQLRLLHSLWTYTSYPDPRLWNNRVAALCGTTRSTGWLGLSAALAISEAAVYGGRSEIRAAGLLRTTQKRIVKGESIEEIVKQKLKTDRVLPGYGRPLVGADERIAHVMKRVEQLGLEGGVYITLALEIERILLAGRWRMRMNFAALTAALCADMDFSPREYYLCAFPAFLAGMIPCLIEANEKPEGTLLPLTCQRIAYAGPARRSW